MELMKKVKGTIASTFVMASLCFGQTAFAQTATTPQTQQQQTQDFSEAELKKFLQANAKAATIQQKSQEAMAKIVEKENLTVEKFSEMAQAHQQQKLDDVDASAEEMAAFNKAAQGIVEMQPQVEKEMKQAIEGEGISIDKFEKIMLAYQQNPEVQAKVNKLLQEQQ